MLRKSIPQNSNTQLSHNSSLLSLTTISRNKLVPEDRLCCCLGPEQTCPTDFGLNFILHGAFISDEDYVTRKENWKGSRWVPVAPRSPCRSPCRKVAGGGSRGDLGLSGCAGLVSQQLHTAEIMARLWGSQPSRQGGFYFQSPALTATNAFCPRFLHH